MNEPALVLTFNWRNAEWLPKDVLIALILKLCKRDSLADVTLEDMRQIAMVCGAHIHSAITVAPTVEPRTDGVTVEQMGRLL